MQKTDFIIFYTNKQLKRENIQFPSLSRKRLPINILEMKNPWEKPWKSPKIPLWSLRLWKTSPLILPSGLICSFPLIILKKLAETLMIGEVMTFSPRCCSGKIPVDPELPPLPLYFQLTCRFKIVDRHQPLLNLYRIMDGLQYVCGFFICHGTFIQGVFGNATGPYPTHGFSVQVSGSASKAVSHSSLSTFSFDTA